MYSCIVECIVGTLSFFCSSLSRTSSPRKRLSTSASKSRSLSLSLSLSLFLTFARSRAHYSLSLHLLSLASAITISFRTVVISFSSRVNAYSHSTVYFDCHEVRIPPLVFLHTETKIFQIEPNAMSIYHVSHI